MAAAAATVSHNSGGASEVGSQPIDASLVQFRSRIENLTRSRTQSMLSLRFHWTDNINCSFTEHLIISRRYSKSFVPIHSFGLQNVLHTRYYYSL